MHPRNKMRLLGGIPIDPVLESREYQEGEKKRKLTEAREVPRRRLDLAPKNAGSFGKVVRAIEVATRHLQQAATALEKAPSVDFMGDVPHWITEIEDILSVDDGQSGMLPTLKVMQRELKKMKKATLTEMASDLQFFVHQLGDGTFAVMTSKGDMHDTYPDESEAQEVADQLNQEHGARHAPANADMPLGAMSEGKQWYAVQAEDKNGKVITGTSVLAENPKEAEREAVARSAKIEGAAKRTVTVDHEVNKAKGVSEGAQVRITRTGPAGQNITIAKPGKAEKRKVKKFDYDGDGKEESQDAELKGMRKKIVDKHVHAGDKIRKLAEEWVQADDNTQFEEGQRIKLSDAYRGMTGEVTDPDPAPSGKYVTLKIAGKGTGYYHKSDVFIREAMHYIDEPATYPISHEEDEDEPINVVAKDDNEETVFDGNWDKDESPAQLHALDIPTPQDRSGGGDLDREFTCPPKILAALKTEIDQARKEAEVLDTSNKPAAIFYQDLATAFEDLANHLRKGTVYDFKQAQIFMQTLMGPMLHKIPAPVIKYLANGGRTRSLKSYMTDVSKEYPVTGPRNTLDDNDWS